MLRLVLRLMFRGCFVINGILILIFVEQLGLGLLIFFVKGTCVLVSLGFIQRESFHWYNRYNRLSYSLFL